MNNSIGSLIRTMESDFEQGITQKSAYVSVNFKDDLNTIDAYLDSKFISGDEDNLGRQKPFFNITLAVRNLWFRATDLDRKNIRMKATKASHYMMAFLASIHLQDWMKKSNFGKFLNDWGLTLASYNEAVVKFVEKDGELKPSVVPWQQLICDTIDFENNPKIEKLYFTPAQLRMNENYDQDMVEELIRAKSTRKSMSGQQKDNKSEYIEVYEVHGNLPLSYLTDKEKDETDYQQQMHVISFQATEGKGMFTDYTLFSGREKQDPYLLTSLIPETDGSIGLKGAVKYLFQAQWMVNHTAKLIKDQLELASKIIFQTSDGSFMGRSALTQIENGDILITAQGQPITQLNNKPDIAAMQAYGQEWQVLAKEITSTPESLRGETLPSGTPYSLGAYLGGQAGSLFEIMTENKGLSIEEMMRRFIIPHLKKKMDTTEEISATLESHQIKQIDSAYVPREAIRVANEQIKKDILSGRLTQSPDLGAIESQIQGKLNELGNQRFIAPSEIKTKKWKEVLKDFVWEVEVEITPEQADKKAMLETLSSVFQTIATNPAILNDPNARLVFNRILENSGAVSPVELQQTPQTPQLPTGQPVAPQVGEQVGAGLGLQTAVR